MRLGTALVSTIAALVLSLLIASANSSFETKSGQVKRMTAQIVLLDQLLDQYGAEARSARDLLRRAIDPLVARIWRESDSARAAPFTATVAGGDAFARINELPATTEAQRSLRDRAIQVSTDVAQTRLLLFEQADSSIPKPFLAVLIFWLAIVFMSFSLFSRLTATVIGALSLFALSASAAIFLVLELSQPFAGLMRISSAPLLNALAPLGQ